MIHEIEHTSFSALVLSEAWVPPLQFIIIITIIFIGRARMTWQENLPG